MSLYATFAGNNRGSGGGGGSGTVTSVGLSLPAEFNVTGSPVTTSGTLTASWASETQNFVFAAPSGGSGTPSFRLLVPSDLPALDYWSLTGNSGTTAGTNYIGTNDAQDLHVKTSGITQIVFSATGGFAATQTNVPADGVSLNQYRLSTDVAPSASTTTANNTNLYSALSYDNGVGNFDYGGNLQVTASAFNHDGAGTISYVSVSDNSASFAAVAGVTSLFKGNNLNVSVGAGYEVTSYNGVNNYLNSTSGILPNSAMFVSSSNLVDAILGNVTSFSENMSLAGTSAASGSLSSVNTNLLLQDSAAANNIFGSNIGVTHASSGTVTSIAGVNSNIQIQNAADVSNVVNGVLSGINVQNTATIGAINLISGNLQTNNTSSNGNITLINATAGMAGSSSASSLSSTNVGFSISDNAVVGNANGAGFYGTVENSAVVTNYSAMNVSATVRDTAQITNFSGGTVNLQVEDTAVITNGVTGMSVSVSSTPNLSSVNGISIDIQNASTADPFVKTAINSSGGSLGVNYNLTVPASTTFFQTHYLGGQEVVAPGASTAAYGFGINLAHSIDFQDDWTVDGTGLRLGFNSVGFVGSVVGTVGKTMDAWTGALSGFGNPSGAGTIDQAIMFRAAGALPQGGSIAVNNMYGFHAGASLSAVSPTNVWGVWIGDSNADNYFAKNVVIGGVTGKPVGSDALDVTGSALVSGAIKTKTSVVLEDPGAGTNTITMKAPTLAADYDLTLPVDGGTAGYVLTTNGSGVTSWAATASVEPYRVNTFTLSAGDITNGYVVLSHIPTVASSTALSVIGGPMQEYGVDFVMIGANLDWNGLGLDGVLTAGDKLVVQFN